MKVPTLPPPAMTTLIGATSLAVGWPRRRVEASSIAVAGDGHVDQVALLGDRSAAGDLGRRRAG